MITSFVGDILTPLLGLLGVPNFAELTFQAGDATVNYGLFLNALIAFVQVALAIFLFVVTMNAWPPVAPAPPKASRPPRPAHTARPTSPRPPPLPDVHQPAVGVRLAQSIEDRLELRWGSGLDDQRLAVRHRQPQLRAACSIRRGAPPQAARRRSACHRALDGRWRSSAPGSVPPARQRLDFEQISALQPLQLPIAGQRLAALGIHADTTRAEGPRSGSAISPVARGTWPSTSAR